MRRVLLIVAMLLTVFALGGCGGALPGLTTVETPALSTDDQVRLGRAALPYTLQLLGGRYPAPELQAALAQALVPLARSGPRPELPSRVEIADHSEPRLDVLSGGQIVVSRGLLASLNSRSGLDLVLGAAVAATAQGPFAGPATRLLTESALQVLENPGASDSPVSPPVRLAEAFVERGGPAPELLSGAGNALPAAWRRLRESRPAYDLLARARRLEAGGERNAAIAAYLQAAAAAPDEPQILAELGMAYLRADDQQSARIHLEKAVSLQPDYYRTRMGLGYLALQSGRVDEAARQLAASLKLLPVTENLFLMAQVHEAGGQMRRARELYREIATADGSSKLGRAARDRLKELQQ